MSLRLHNIEFHLPSESNMKKTKQILSKVTSELKELKRKLSKLERRRPASKYEKEVQKLYVDIAQKRQLVGKYQIVPDYFYANNKKYIKKKNKCAKHVKIKRNAQIICPRGATLSCGPVPRVPVP